MGGLSTWRYYEVGTTLTLIIVPHIINKFEHKLNEL